MNAHHALLDDLNPDVVIPVVVPAVTYAAIVTIVAISLFFRYRTQQMRQDLYKSFIEKGEPIPESFLPGTKRRSRNGDLRFGLVLLTGGVGLSASLLLAGQMQGAPFGIIPALIGAGFLLVWKVEAGAQADARGRG
jgi:hypothetical protein